jgi:hypothetical protein
VIPDNQLIALGKRSQDDVEEVTVRVTAGSYEPCCKGGRGLES